MTKTDWTAEEVLDEAARAGDHSGLAQQMLAHLAERIEADQRAVPVGVVEASGYGGHRARVPASIPIGTKVFTHPPAQPAQPAQVENPDDLNGDPSGEWYCEEHPQFLQSHDNCGGAGIPSCARIPCLMHQIRQLEQRNRELVHQYGFLADLATAAQTVDVEAVEYVIDVLRLDAKTFSFTGLDNAHFVRLADKLSQAIGDKT